MPLSFPYLAPFNNHLNLANDQSNRSANKQKLQQLSCYFLRANPTVIKQVHLSADSRMRVRLCWLLDHRDSLPAALPAAASYLLHPQAAASLTSDDELVLRAAAVLSGGILSFLVACAMMVSVLITVIPHQIVRGTVVSMCVYSPKWFGLSFVHAAGDVVPHNPWSGVPLINFVYSILRQPSSPNPTLDQHSHFISRLNSGLAVRLDCKVWCVPCCSTPKQMALDGRGQHTDGNETRSLLLRKSCYDRRVTPLLGRRFSRLAVTVVVWEGSDSG